MRTPLMLLAAAVLLAACSGDEVKNGAAASMKAWCRNAPNCTVQEDR